MGHTRAWRTAVAAAAAAVAVAAITVPSVAAETAAAPVAPAAAAAPAAPAAAAVTVAAPCNSPLVAGTLPVTIDGVTTQWTVVAAGAAKGVAIAGGAMTMQHDYRGYLVDLSAGDGCPQAWDPSLYDRRLQLLGKQLNYTVDLSTSGCGCNAALYLVGMPGHNSSQQPAPGQGGDFYCDANDVGGVWCPEVDIAEANNMAYQATPHRCAAPTGLWYPSCDKSGCGRNTYRHCGPSCYGPGGAYTIDTTKPFVVSTSFVTDASGTLTNMTTVLAQGSASIELAHYDGLCGADYLEDMTAPLADGMVMTFSVWGSDAKTMSWLDIPPCDATVACAAEQAAMVISGITVASL